MQTWRLPIGLKASDAAEMAANEWTRIALADPTSVM
jgi:hypothetical protein